MAPTASPIFSSLTSRLLFVLILVLVVDDIATFKINSKAKGEAARPLYGIILNGPYPKPHYSKPPPYPHPYKPFRPVYRPPIPYAKPHLPYYPSPPPYYPVPPPTPAIIPYRPPVTQTYPQAELYRPPTSPVYQSTTPTSYRPPVRPVVSHPVRFPIPTTFDNKPWEPILPTSASYVLDPAVQLNEVDGYPWTEELRDADGQEEDQLPDLLFRDKLPSKSLAQQHAAENEINFSPNPELRN